MLTPIVALDLDALLRQSVYNWLTRHDLPLAAVRVFSAAELIFHFYLRSNILDLCSGFLHRINVVQGVD